MTRILAALLLWVLLAAALPAVETSTISLDDLAAKSDLVVLAQARDTDYFMRREIPVSGSAYLRVLIPYKTDQSVDIVEVYEKGLHKNECYFSNPTVFEEGRRYLLFLVRDPDDPERYRGHPEGCALEVLVDSDNRYALRYPVDGIQLSDDLEALARPMTFSDGYSVTKDEDLSPDKRNAMRSAGQIEAHGEAGWRYTRGIPLGEARRLIGPEALER